MFRHTVFGMLGMAFVLPLTAAYADDALQPLLPPTDADRSYLTKMPESHEPDRGQRCMELARQLEELKGKPQRRFAVSQQYDAECKE